MRGSGALNYSQNQLQSLLHVQRKPSISPLRSKRLRENKKSDPIQLPFTPSSIKIPDSTLVTLWLPASWVVSDKAAMLTASQISRCHLRRHPQWPVYNRLNPRAEIPEVPYYQTMTRERWSSSSFASAEVCSLSGWRWRNAPGWPSWLAHDIRISPISNEFEFEIAQMI